jgi:cation diffusion facilitator family transporter
LFERKLEGNEGGFAQGETIARLSALTLLAIGSMEIIVGRLSNSVSLTADGVDGISDAIISSIVWFGLRYSRKAPDDRFHFGYLRVENLSALLASFGMVTVATLLAYISYERFLQPTELSYTSVAIFVLFLAGTISLYRAIQMRKIARKYNLISLKTDAFNSIKDSSASFIVLGAVLASTYGFTLMDAIGGIVVAGYIYTVAYVSIRESSLILLDAFHNPELVNDIKSIIHKKYDVEVANVRLRRTGPYIVGTVSIYADGRLTLSELDALRENIRKDLIKEIEGLSAPTIVFHAKKVGAPSTSGRSDSERV